MTVWVTDSQGTPQNLPVALRDVSQGRHENYCRNSILQPANAELLAFVEL